MSQKQRDEVMNLPLVREVVDLFDAQLIDVRPNPGNPGAPGNPGDPATTPPQDQDDDDV